jgi:hypothetical protein
MQYCTLNVTAGRDLKMSSQLGVSMTPAYVKKKKKLLSSLPLNKKERNKGRKN